MGLNKLDNIIDEALRKDPEIKIEPAYRDKVIYQIRKNKSKANFKQYLLISIITCILGGLGVGMIFMFKIQLAIQELGQIIPMAVLFGAILVVFQYLDKKLIKDKLINRLT